MSTPWFVKNMLVYFHSSDSKSDVLICIFVQTSCHWVLQIINVSLLINKRIFTHIHADISQKTVCRPCFIYTWLYTSITLYGRISNSAITVDWWVCWAVYVGQVIIELAEPIILLCTRYF